MAVACTRLATLQLMTFIYFGSFNLLSIFRTECEVNIYDKIKVNKYFVKCFTPNWLKMKFQVTENTYQRISHTKKQRGDPFRSQKKDKNTIGLRSCFLKCNKRLTSLRLTICVKQVY